MNDTTRMLNRTIHEHRRRTDRYIRMFHRTAADEIKQHWFDLAVENDRKAADAARRLATLLRDVGSSYSEEPGVEIL